MDKVKTLGKQINQGRTKANQALRNNTEIFPSVDRSRDIITNDRHFEMLFQTWEKNNSIAIDIYFFKGECITLGG